jgi:hypothetical protein
LIILIAEPSGNVSASSVTVTGGDELFTTISF